MNRLGPYAYPAAALVIVVAAWHMVTASGLVPSYLLPTPWRVGEALLTGLANGNLTRHLLATLEASALGWLCGSLAALGFASAIAESKVALRSLLWPLTAIQSIPKVSIAPLVFLWAGFGSLGKVVLVALICFFPVFANALVGFRGVDPNLVDLMRVHGASRLHRFRVVSLPTAAPAIFAGLEVSAAFALIGCVVMEFIGATSGLGFLIQDASNTFDLATVFAAVLALGLVGVAINAGVRALQRRVIFWGGAVRAAAAGEG
jgi:NitT/TauT family transport system permease protein